MRLACSSGWRETRHAAPTPSWANCAGSASPRRARAAPQRGTIRDGFGSGRQRARRAHHQPAACPKPSLAACDARAAADGGGSRAADDRHRASTGRDGGAGRARARSSCRCARCVVAGVRCRARVRQPRPSHSTARGRAGVTRARARPVPSTRRSPDARALGEHARGSTVRIGVMSAAHFRAMPSVDGARPDAARTGRRLLARDGARASAGLDWTLARPGPAARGAPSDVLACQWRTRAGTVSAVRQVQGDVDFLELGPFAGRACWSRSTWRPDVADAALPRATRDAAAGWIWLEPIRRAAHNGQAMVSFGGGGGGADLPARKASSW